MALGVGKTYAMLEAARRELATGRDVVIGYVETHKRKETDALTEGLPIIPRLSFEYRGVTLTELDLDAVRHQIVRLRGARGGQTGPGQGCAPPPVGQSASRLLQNVWGGF